MLCRKEDSVRFMERLGFEFVPEDSASLETKLHAINYPIFVCALTFLHTIEFVNVKKLTDRSLLCQEYA